MWKDPIVEEIHKFREEHAKKLTWEETFKTMSEKKENWNDFDVTMMDGLEEENLDS